MTPEEVTQKIAVFKAELSAREAVEVARRHIIFGDCAVISQNEYFNLRTEVAREYDLHPNEVLVVGSGKLGFSIAPMKRYRPFNDQSDLDVVIVSRHFFDFVWSDVHRYYLQGGFWAGKENFQECLFRGWIRPDKLPPDQVFDFAADWWEFFNELSASRRYPISRIRGAIYKNWYFLESYQNVAISECAKELQNVGIENEN